MANSEILNEKLDSLLQGIQKQYGTALTDELIARLENTITEFNEEVDQLMNELKEIASQKEKMLADIKAGKTQEKTIEPSEDSVEEEKEMSAWEKRLEKLS